MLLAFLVSLQIVEHHAEVVKLLIGRQQLTFLLGDAINMACSANQKCLSAYIHGAPQISLNAFKQATEYLQ